MTGLTESQKIWAALGGERCDVCKNPVSLCICRKTDVVNKEVTESTPIVLTHTGGKVIISKSRKKRGGKVVTLITGVNLPTPALNEFGRILKIKCGTGGTVKDGVIEVQGDHIQTLASELEKSGYTVRISGV
ncbi:stress response translation initiation inhibitor YciH [Myxococcota bacterium]|nr:stress response translation initiation inhibitor YciH [Myxococcota bacterium]MBU1379259.1 stress response translation initiation inhibitor YciH [Myxococcota bacterium]MBU1496107.1 stress response translation initiation inhibitor YciH [Myxococcota bacterium]